MQPAIAPNGTLTYAPAPDANGVATVRVVLHDDGGTANGGVDTSAAQTFAIVVGGLNDAPSFSKGDAPVFDANSGGHSLERWATGIVKGPANESSQKVGFRVSNDNPSLFSTQPSIDSAGTLLFASKANAHGSAVVSVRIGDDGGRDGGGIDSGDVQTFVVTIRGILLNLHPPVVSTGGGGAAASDTLSEGRVDVTVFSATDEDSGSVVRYSIQGGDDAALFRIDSVDGRLRFVSAPDYERPASGAGTNVYTVVLRAGDGLHDVVQTHSVVVEDVFEPTDPPARIVLRPDTLHLLPGGGGTIGFSVYARTGGLLSVDSSRIDWAWRPALGTLQRGRILASRIGRSVVTARIGNVEDSVLLVVSGLDSVVRSGSDSIELSAGAGVGVVLPPNMGTVDLAVDPVDAPELAGMAVSDLAVAVRTLSVRRSPTTRSRPAAAGRTRKSSGSTTRAGWRASRR